jgi:hypothetical protein
MMKRREFLATSLAASAMIGTGTAHAASAHASGSKREYYELIQYHLKDEAGTALVNEYLKEAAIPALNRAGIKTVGAFNELEPKDGPALWLLLPHASLDSVASTPAKLDKDSDYRKAAAKYLGTPKSNPAFARKDSWLLLAFEGMPQLELSDLSRKKSTRVFEMRTYESHNEAKALKKVEMFNSGEIDVMREVKLAPVFYGQALIGRDLPHLTYMLCGESKDLHKQHFSAFSKHPIWQKLKDDPQYADTVSKIISRFLEPTEYSQI